MRIKFYFFLFIIFRIAFSCHSQNLASNPGFELFSVCPNTVSQLQLATGWNTSQNTPDYFNVCAGTGSFVNVPQNICGYQQPDSGNGYIGILCYGSFATNPTPNLREFATGTLITSLTVGSTYSVSFKVVLMNKSSHIVDHVGAKFMTSYISNLQNTNSAHVWSSMAISDTLNWTTINGTFVADSAYNFIVIGNHFDDSACMANMIQPVTFGLNAYYFVDNVEVKELIQPLAMFTAPDHMCPGTCIDFTNLSSQASTYQWFFPGGNPDTSSSVSPTNICYAMPGSYDVQLIATNTNGSDTLLLTNYITVYPLPPSQSISQSGDTLFAIAGSNSYQWYYNGNIISGATDYFFVASASGDYNVVATDTNGCEVEAVINDVLAHTPLAVGFLPLAIYPNPVGETLSVIGYSLSGTAVEISIYNVLGEKIYSAEYKEQSIVNCESYPKGIYWLELSSPEKTYRAKFMKQ